MEKEFRFLVGENEDGERADRAVTAYADTFSRSFVQKLFESGHVTVNGKAIKPSYKLKEGDGVCMLVPPEVEPDIIPENIPLSVLYEDSDILVVDKPKHMVVHPAPGHLSGTLVNAVMYHCGDSLSGINGVLRPGIVHRIDMDTSGSLIICKNDKAHNHIALQLKDHSLSREYRAIVYGVLEEDEYTIDKPLGRDPKDRMKMAVVPGGKRAVTHVKVLARSDKYTYVACRLETGRTHQIRVHMAYLGHPIVGDEVYTNGRKCPFKCEGQTLHAYLIGFVHPTSGQYMEFKAPIPEYFCDLLKKTGCGEE